MNIGHSAHADEEPFSITHQTVRSNDKVKTTSSSNKEEVSTRQAYVLLLNGEWDKAISMFQHLRERMPEDPSLPFGLGLAYQKKGDNERALQFYREVAQHPGVTPAMKRNVAINAAVAAPTKPESLRYLQNLSNKGDTTPELLKSIAQVYWQNGNLPRARDFFKRATEGSNEAAIYHYNIAVISDTLNDKTAAISHYQQALESPLSEKLLSSNELQSARLRFNWLEKQGRAPVAVNPIPKQRP